MKKQILIDSREPIDSRLTLQNLEKAKKELNFECDIIVTLLKRGDLLFVCDDGKIFVEIKRNNTGDSITSKNTGRLKKQINDLRKPDELNTIKYPWYVVFINEIDIDIPFIQKKGLNTLEAEIESLGGRSKKFDSDYWFSRWFIRTCQMMTKEYPVVFEPFCNVVEKDSSDFTKMLLQINGFGNDADRIGKEYNSFWDMMFDENIRQVIESELDLEKLKVILSNDLRILKDKKEQEKPLTKISNLVDWFFNKSNQNKNEIK